MIEYGVSIVLYEIFLRRGLAGLLRPWQIKRVGKAQNSVEKDRMYMVFQAEQDEEDIKSGKKTIIQNKKGQYECVPTTPSDNNDVNVSDAIHEAAYLHALRKEVNAAQTIIKAAKILEDNPKSKEKLDPKGPTINDDWLHKWYDYAGDTSDQVVQSLWARVLSDEFTQPGKYSLRTLDFLRSISKGEADKIYHVLTFSFAGGIIKNDFLKGAVRFSDLLELQELGIISGVEGDVLYLTLEAIPDADVNTNEGGKKQFDFRISYGEKAIILHHKEEKINIPIYKLTQVGRDLLSLANTQVNEEYFESILHYFSELGYEVSTG